MNPKSYIQWRKTGGYIHMEKKMASELVKLYPNDTYVKQEAKYWKLVYWFTGELTKKLGIDQKRDMRRKEWIPQKYVAQKIKMNDISLTLDHPSLCALIFYEYPDIFPQGMYYDKSGNWLVTPDLIQKNFGGEGPYETTDVQLHKDDVVIDCGANIGLFSILAAKRGAKTIYAFDPQERAQELLNANIVNNKFNEQIIPIPYGLSDKKCTFSFIDEVDNMGGSHITQDESAATTTIECTTIDDFVSENNIPRIDFIKADIEGAERDMLNGARKTIKRDHPRLAICTYHLPDDPEVIRDIILSIDPTYHIDQRSAKLYAW